MKKAYSKPVIYRESLDMCPVLSTCQTAGDYWPIIPVHGTDHVIFHPSVMNCNITPKDYMQIDSDWDKECLYGPTNDSRVFS